MKPRIPVVFVLCCGHSGSTLLDLLLNAHSRLVGAGEVEKIGVKTRHPDARCSCFREFPSCPFWGPYVRTHDRSSLVAGKIWQLEQRKSNLLLNGDTYVPLTLEGRDIFLSSKPFSLEAYIQDFEEIYEYMLQASRAFMVVDSSKNPIRARAFERHSQRIDPRFIFIVRDGRGVTWSYAKKYGKFLKYMWRWFAENMKAEIALRRSNVPVLRVSYYALTTRPERELERICKFLGIPFEHNMMNFQSKEHHYVGGNAGTIAGPSFIREDVAWKKEMPLFWRFAFLSLFGVANMFWLLAARSNRKG